MIEFKTIFDIAYVPDRSIILSRRASDLKLFRKDKDVDYC